MTKKGSRGFPFEIGAGEESRTLDLNLGKVALYQLSYSRVCETMFLNIVSCNASNSSLLFSTFQRAEKFSNSQCCTDAGVPPAAGTAGVTGGVAASSSVSA